MPATFDITSLLASTPRSRHLRCIRTMRIHASRSPRSATRRIRGFRTAFRLTPTRRWRPHRRSTLKGSGETVSPPARRYLELSEFDPPSRAQLLVTQLYEESISITTIQSFLGNLVEIVREHYPELNHRFLSDSSGNYHWLELKSPKIHFDPDLGPNDVVRMVISEQRLYYIQVLFPFLRSVTKGMSNITELLVIVLLVQLIFVGLIDSIPRCCISHSTQYWVCFVPWLSSGGIQ